MIDYALHEGCNARALVQVDPPDDTAELDPATLVFFAGEAQFRPIGAAPVRLCRARTSLAVHCWGDAACELPKGSTGATLVDDAPTGAPPLLPGDFLLFEVMVAGPDSAPDPDPRRHHAVRLVDIRASRDPLLETNLLEVAWSQEDALPAIFPLGTDGPVTMVRGNLVLVERGTPVEEGGHGARIAPTVGPGRRRAIALARAGIGFAEPVAPDESAWRTLARRVPHRALPLIDGIRSFSADPQRPPVAWEVRPDLIGSLPDDPHVVVEMDADGVAVLRFGDGTGGRDPAGEAFEIAYRIGNGPAGNVGTGAIDRLRIQLPDRLEEWPVRNPLPATGGSVPEPLEQARLLAPQAMRGVPVRAVTAEDYAALAALDPAVQRAACSLLPSGGRQIARVAIDPLGSEQAEPVLLARVAAALEDYRRIGHDIRVVAALYVPLRLVLRVELENDAIQGHLRAAVRAVLGTGVLAEGHLAAFHPDRLSFGTPIHGSPLLAAVQVLEGVRAVRILDLARQFDQERGRYADGVLQMAWNEIPQLDDDRLHPDRGRLVLRFAGGIA
jgi:hypothetical protein